MLFLRMLPTKLLEIEAENGSTDLYLFFDQICRKNHFYTIFKLKEYFFLLN